MLTKSVNSLYIIATTIVQFHFCHIEWVNAHVLKCFLHTGPIPTHFIWICKLSYYNTYIVVALVKNIIHTFSIRSMIFFLICFSHEVIIAGCLLILYFLMNVESVRRWTPCIDKLRTTSERLRNLSILGSRAEAEVHGQWLQLKCWVSSWCMFLVCSSSTNGPNLPWHSRHDLALSSKIIHTI